MITSRSNEGALLRASAVAVLMLVCLLLAVPDGASAATAKTTVTIEAQEGGFFGVVTSKRASCEAGRKVSLYRQTGSRRDRSRDRRIGSDIAHPNGPDSMWSISTEAGGRFYAFVSPNSKCAAAYSKTVSAQTEDTPAEATASASAST